MKLSRLILILCAAATPAGNVHAQANYPRHPIRIVVPFAPGGTSDVLARAIGAKMHATMGQPVLVDNRAGAGTTLASSIVAKSSPDGYTLFLQDISAHAINATAYRNLRYDSIKDFTPIAPLATTPLLLSVHPSLPVRSLKELIALAKSKPGQIVYASSGNGTILHLSMERLKSLTGIDMVHVPYNNPPAVMALLTGEVAVSFTTMPPALPLVKAGRLRALAVSSARRVAAAPDVPTIDEAGGFKGYEMVVYSGILGPAGMSRDIVAKLNGEVEKIVNSADLRQTLATIGASPVTASPDEFAAHLRKEIDRLGAIVKAVGVSLH